MPKTLQNVRSGQVALGPLMCMERKRLVGPPHTSRKRGVRTPQVAENPSVDQKNAKFGQGKKYKYKRSLIFRREALQVNRGATHAHLYVPFIRGGGKFEK